jgi:hypothetical protein
VAPVAPVGPVGPCGRDPPVPDSDASSGSSPTESNNVASRAPAAVGANRTCTEQLEPAANDCGQLDEVTRKSSGSSPPVQKTGETIELPVVFVTVNTSGEPIVSSASVPKYVAVAERLGDTEPSVAVIVNASAAVVDVTVA